MRLRVRMMRLSDPRAAGIHQPGRFEVMRLGRHGTAVLITGRPDGRKGGPRERAWIVLW